MLCAVFSLCYVLSLVCVLCSLSSVLFVVCSHEPRRFAPSVTRFARYVTAAFDNYIWQRPIDE